MADAFKKLNCWKNSIDMVLKVYLLSKNFPEEEKFGFTSQIRRAAISVSNNIAEGTGVGSKKHEINHLHIAVGSCNEVENLSIIANRLEYITESEKDDIEDLVTQTRKPLFGLIKRIDEKIKNDKN